MAIVGNNFLLGRNCYVFKSGQRHFGRIVCIHQRSDMTEVIVELETGVMVLASISDVEMEAGAWKRADEEAQASNLKVMQRLRAMLIRSLAATAWQRLLRDRDDQAEWMHQGITKEAALDHAVRVAKCDAIDKGTYSEALAALEVFQGGKLFDPAEGMRPAPSSFPREGKRDVPSPEVGKDVEECKEGGAWRFGKLDRYKKPLGVPVTNPIPLDDASEDAKPVKATPREMDFTRAKASPSVAEREAASRLPDRFGTRRKAIVARALAFWRLGARPAVECVRAAAKDAGYKFKGNEAYELASELSDIVERAAAVISGAAQDDEDSEDKDKAILGESLDEAKLVVEGALTRNVVREDEYRKAGSHLVEELIFRCAQAHWFSGERSYAACLENAVKIADRLVADEARRRAAARFVAWCREQGRKGEQGECEPSPA